MSTLYSVSAIGLGLFLYEGHIWPFFVAVVAYVIGYGIARREDYDN